MTDGPASSVAFGRLPGRYLELQEEAREVASAIASIAVEADECSEVHPQMLNALRASDLPGLTVPAAFGGRQERVDPLAICVVREVLMSTSSHLDSLFALQGIGSFALSLAGTSQQREHWLPRVATAEVLPAIALTEPEAGSDLRSVLTEVRRAGNGLILSGEKAFISNAGVAGFYLTFVREGDGHSLFLVPADRQGVSTAPAPELIAPHVLGSVNYDEVEVHDSDRVGEPNEGFALVLGTLAVFRASVAGASVGLAGAALDEAARHASQRKQFGRPLVALGPVAQMIADAATEIEMARLLAYSAASRAQGPRPEESLDYSSMAKLAATEMASRVVDRCVQVMGRWGLIRGSRIERLYRQARPMRIYEGASEVLRQGIARSVCNNLP